MKIILSLLLICTSLSVFSCTCIKPLPVYPLLYTIDANNNLYLWNSSIALIPLTQVRVTNLEEGEQLLSIDIRPSNNELYAIGSGNNLYTINPLTGVAALVAELQGCSILVDGGLLPVYSINFDPQAGTLRIVDIASDNYKVNPDNGHCVIENNRYFDHASGAGYCGGYIGYTNNYPGATETQQYTASGWWIIVTDPNEGNCHTLGDTDLVQLSGVFDIYTTESGENFPLLIQNGQILTFSLENGGDQLIVSYIDGSGYPLSYVGVSVLPYNYPASKLPASTTV